MPQTTESDNLLSPEQLAEYLCIGSTYAYNLLATNVFRYGPWEKIKSQVRRILGALL
jgi:hypothetical protein